MSNLSCRIYRNKYPNVDDVVLINIQNITDIGVYVDLFEYNNIEGMIILSELSRRRIKSVKQEVSLNKPEPAGCTQG